MKYTIKNRHNDTVIVAEEAERFRDVKDDLVACLKIEEFKDPN